MNTYTLFLDERDDKENKDKLLVAGFAINDCDYSLLEAKILDIKKLFWDETYIASNETILHCAELNCIYSYRKSKNLWRFTTRPCYNFFKTLDAEDIQKRILDMTSKLEEILIDLDITIFGCEIDYTLYNELYSISSERDDPYNVALECIIENYVHFLNRKKAVGKIIYESRNSGMSSNAPNVTMNLNFSKILANNKGIIHITNNSKNDIKSRIRTIEFKDKTVECSGLEFADFLVYYLFKARLIQSDDQKSSFIKAIEKNLYNGSYKLEDKDLRYHFGIRLFPFNYENISSLEKCIKKLNRALTNSKKSIKKIEKKNKQIIEEKRKIQESNVLLQKEIDELKKNIHEKNSILSSPCEDDKN